jgi:hypothetical protein
LSMRCPHSRSRSCAGGGLTARRRASRFAGWFTLSERVVPGLRRKLAAFGNRDTRAFTSRSYQRSRRGLAPRRIAAVPPDPAPLGIRSRGCGPRRNRDRAVLDGRPRAGGGYRPGWTSGSLFERSWPPAGPRRRSHAHPDRVACERPEIVRLAPMVRLRANARGVEHHATFFDSEISSSAGGMRPSNQIAAAALPMAHPSCPTPGIVTSFQLQVTPSRFASRRPQS